MRFRQIALLGVCAALVLSACTSTPESAIEPNSSPTPSGAVENASEQPPHVTRIRAPGYPDSVLPKRLPVGERTVTTRLQCESEGRSGFIGDGRYWEMTLREMALLATAEREGSTAVIVIKSHREGMVLAYNKTGELLTRWNVTRLGKDWAIDGITFCKGYNTVSLMP